MTVNIDIGGFAIVVIVFIVIGGITSVFDSVYSVEKTDFQACISSCPLILLSTSDEPDCKDTCRASLLNCSSSKEGDE